MLSEVTSKKKTLSLRKRKKSTQPPAETSRHPSEANDSILAPCILQVAKLREEHTSAQTSLAAALAELAASSEKETEHYDIAQVYATPLFPM